MNIKPPTLIFADVIFIVAIAALLTLFMYWMAGNGLLPTSVPLYINQTTAALYSGAALVAGLSASILSFLFKRAITIWHGLSIVGLTAVLVITPYALVRPAPSPEKWRVLEHIGFGNYKGNWSVRFDGNPFPCAVSAPGLDIAKCIGAAVGNKRFIYRPVAGTDNNRCSFNDELNPETKKISGEYYCQKNAEVLLWSAELFD